VCSTSSPSSTRHASATQSRWLVDRRDALFLGIEHRGLSRERKELRHRAQLRASSRAPAAVPTPSTPSQARQAQEARMLAQLSEAQDELERAFHAFPDYGPPPMSGAGAAGALRRAHELPCG